MRALFDQNPGRIYCLVHAEKLSYLVADKAIDLLSCLSQGISGKILRTYKLQFLTVLQIIGWLLCVAMNQKESHMF